MSCGRPMYLQLLFAADQLRWEKEVEQYERKFPNYRSHLAQKHVKKLNDKGIIDIQLSQLGIKKPFTARHYYIKEQVEVNGSLFLAFSRSCACQQCRLSVASASSA